MVAERPSCYGVGLADKDRRFSGPSGSKQEVAAIYLIG